MKRPIKFRKELILSALGGIEAIDRAVLTSVLNEVESEDLLSEILTPNMEGTPHYWDVCFATIFNDGIKVRHWSRPLHGNRDVPLNIHKLTRRLRGSLPSVRVAKHLAEQLRTIAARPALATIVFLAIARLEDGREHVTVWWNPRLTKKEALVGITSFIEYQLEENL